MIKLTRCNCNWPVITKAIENDVWFNKNERVTNYQELFDISAIKCDGTIMTALPNFIKHDSSLTKTETNDVYNIVRRSTHDGTLVFLYESMTKVMLPVLQMNSCHTGVKKKFIERYPDTVENGIFGICYIIGDITIINEFDDIEYPMCQRQTISMPVKCFYAKDEDDFNCWLKGGL